MRFRCAHYRLYYVLAADTSRLLLVTTKCLRTEFRRTASHIQCSSPRRAKHCSSSKPGPIFVSRIWYFTAVHGFSTIIRRVRALLLSCSTGECQQAAAEAETPEEREELKPSAITYINLINACEHCGRLDRAFDVFAGAFPDNPYCAHRICR